jgi:hypothetical protein
MNFEHELLSFLMKFQVVEENVTIKETLSLSVWAKESNITKDQNSTTNFE